jgi:hypothetical protein
MSRTHFKQSVGELVNLPISTNESSEPARPKLKLETKTSLEQEGDITNICVITRIFISRANQGT